MPAAKITIPDDLAFADLGLRRTPDGTVSFDWRVIERVCEVNGLPIDTLRNEGNVASLIAAWYLAHRQAGGMADPIAEDLIGEINAEDAAGQHESHKPGTA